MNLLGLFSGIGGFELGFQRAGYEIVGMCEREGFCRSVLAHHFPGVPIFPDVTTLHSSEWIDRSVRSWYGEPSSDWEVAMAGKLKKMTLDQSIECVRMYERGMSAGEIGGYFDISRQSMWSFLRRRTKIRPRERYGPANHFFRGTRDDDHAQNIVEKAVAKGILISQPCESCGKTGAMKDGRNVVQAHHDDYNKPLEVRWLCQPCHHEWHKNHKAKAKEVLAEVPGTVNIVCGGFP